MQEYTVEKDIQLCCETVPDFPMGISTAFRKLEEALPEVKKRTFYGVSHGKPGGIIYKAAVEAVDANEANQYGFEPFAVKRGNEQAIGQTFSEILANYDIDPTGACIEVYTGEDVRCMVSLRD